MKVATREDYDEALRLGCGCGAEDCDHGPLKEGSIYSICHSGEGLDACYRTDGTIELVCHVCQKQVAVIAVASKSEPAAEETVTLSKSEHIELLNDQSKLDALESAGVDNWEGYDDAMEFFNPIR